MSWVKKLAFVSVYGGISIQLLLGVRCQECGRRFFWASGLRAHGRAHAGRAGRAALACPWPGCARVFRQPCRLREHARAHTGDKPYPCRYPVTDRCTLFVQNVTYSCDVLLRICVITFFLPTGKYFGCINVYLTGIYYLRLFFFG